MEQGKSFEELTLKKQPFRTNGSDAKDVTLIHRCDSTLSNLDGCCNAREGGKVNGPKIKINSPFK